MSNGKATRKSSNKVDTSGVRAGDTLEPRVAKGNTAKASKNALPGVSRTTDFISELNCKVCKEPVEFYKEDKARNRKPTTYSKHCEPHLECIRKRMCEDNYNVTEICRAFKFNRTTFYKWIKKYPALKEIIDEVNEVQVDTLKGVLMDFACDKNPKTRTGAVRSAEILLKAKAPEEFAERSKTEISGEVDFGSSLNSILNKRRKRLREAKSG